MGVVTTIPNSSAIKIKALEVKEKFENIFTKFASCHNVYNGNTLKENEINKFGA